MAKHKVKKNPGLTEIIAAENWAKSAAMKEIENVEF
jgi:hypothetical protein